MAGRFDVRGVVVERAQIIGHLLQSDDLSHRTAGTRLVGIAGTPWKVRTEGGIRDLSLPSAGTLPHLTRGGGLCCRSEAAARDMLTAVVAPQHLRRPAAILVA
jgi:hypothetical protein